MREEPSPTDKLRVFISYSRRDDEIADALVAALIGRGFDVRIDTRDLPFGEKWQTELAEFIRLSDTVIWLVSDHSVKSEWVNWELDEVAKRNKRLVPVMVGDTARDQLPRQLGEIHILPAAGRFELARDLDPLVQVLETDHAWLKEASRLGDRAHEWLVRGRTGALLLRGTALGSAERWKDRRPAKAPPPAQQVLDLILGSRQAATWRQRWWVGGSLMVATGGVVLASLAYLQSVEATVQREVAIKNEVRAQSERDQALTTESLFDADLSRQKISDGDNGAAILVALEALPDVSVGKRRPYVAEAELQLDRAIRGLRERIVLAGHGAKIMSVAFSPDGTRIITGSKDSTARVWDASSGKVIASLEGHQRVVTSVVFSPDGSQVLTASSDTTARVWEAVTGKLIAQLQGHEGAIARAAFSPDGARVVTASTDKTARIWDAATGKEIARLNGHCPLDVTYGVGGCVIQSAAFSPDGTRIVTAANDQTARVWDAASGKEVASLDGHCPTGINYGIVGCAINTAVFSPDGARIVTASYDATARVWDAATGKEIAAFTGHHTGEDPGEGEVFSGEGAVYSANFSPDGRLVVTGSGDKDHTARIWEAATGRELARLEGHRSLVITAAFSPDGKRVLTASEDGTARLWSAADGKLIATLAGHEHGLTAAIFSPDGDQIVTASADNTARIWGPPSDKLVKILSGSDSVHQRAVFSPDGSRLVTTAQDDTPLVWDVATGKLIGRLEGHEHLVFEAAFSPDGKRIVTGSLDSTARVWEAASGSVIATLKGHGDIVNSAVFSPDGTRILTGSQDKTARVWDAASGKLLATLEGHEESVSAAFNRDGSRIVTSGDKTARVWDAVTGKLLVKLLGHDKSLYSAAFSPDGARVLTASADNTARVWDADSGRELTRLEGHCPTGVDYGYEGCKYLTAAFSTDGTRIVTGSGDRTARVWDATSGKELSRLEGHGDKVMHAAFSPDGARIVTASEDKTARLWDAKSGKEVARLEGHKNYVMDAAFSPDGRWLATASFDASARLWRIFRTTEELIASAKDTVARCLTPDQRHKFFLPAMQPDWCIGRGLWPYHTGDWQAWLTAKKAGREIPLPKTITGNEQY